MLKIINTVMPVNSNDKLLIEKFCTVYMCYLCCSCNTIGTSCHNRYTICVSVNSSVELNSCIPLCYLVDGFGWHLVKPMVHLQMFI